ncbi:uncharacterized protein MELLADRAFT_108502 [Melampsora larici-populina 98AG31]|uniref:Uncharacterized protein n=1 Tax=Melampsora larici-populina (strain 98AG31 / pathotype 3-4-7) TaxID=747676 RepID=F4RTA7_MELLP|nr:uncharacterized protein MELLADRAFT_108502 [Melampsora larici-populina 98AG31]EGG04229.1 hypothetical protein MELLADRAFT_108502 [Melampsora larici-populina 98AG31]
MVSMQARKASGRTPKLGMGRVGLHAMSNCSAEAVIDDQSNYITSTDEVGEPRLVSRCTLSTAAKDRKSKGGNHKPNNHNTTPDGKAKVGGCQYKGTGDVKKEIDMLNREVKQMNGIVGGLGKKGGNYIELAKHGICSEIQQNGARAFLAGPKVANLTADLNEINKLISQIIDLLNKFISGKGQSDQSAAKLAQDITAIRGKAKPSKGLLFIHISLSSTRAYESDSS